MLATNVGNDNTNSVIIVDSQSNVLYSGNKANSSFTSNSTQKVKAMLENAIIKGAEDLIYSTRLYNDVQIMINLDVNLIMLRLLTINILHRTERITVCQPIPM